MNKQILVVETLKAVAGKKELLKKALTTLVPICRQAPGCLKYDLFEPVEKKDEFLILMSFRSLDDLKNHETSEYITNFVKNYEQILYDEVKCTEYYPLSGSE